MKRVMIIGQPGSGKSTLARTLGARTSLPIYHMDHIHWKPGWTEHPSSEKIALATEIENRDTWIFEGGLSATYPHRLARCDTLICLDLPLWLRTWRIAKRTFRHHGRTRPDLPMHCPERFDIEFWSYIWRTRASGRLRQNQAMAKAAPDVGVYHLTSPARVRSFLDSI